MVSPKHLKVLSTQGYEFYQLDPPARKSDPRVNAFFPACGPLSSPDLVWLVELVPKLSCGGGQDGEVDLQL